MLAVDRSLRFPESQQGGQSTPDGLTLVGSQGHVGREPDGQQCGHRDQSAAARDGIDGAGDQG